MKSGGDSVECPNPGDGRKLGLKLDPVPVPFGFRRNPGSMHTKAFSILVFKLPMKQGVHWSFCEVQLIPSPASFVAGAPFSLHSFSLSCCVLPAIAIISGPC